MVMPPVGTGGEPASEQLADRRVCVRVCGYHPSLHSILPVL
jgi:hypothetical protein